MLASRTLIVTEKLIDDSDCPTGDGGYSSWTTSYQTIRAQESGGVFGKWGCVKLCPNNTKAIGFSIKVESPQGSGDDTALNGITLICNDTARTRISSYRGLWGNVTKEQYCANSSASLKNFELRVEGFFFGIGDDTEVNDINFTCTDGQVLKGNSPTTWGSWSSARFPNANGCQYGIRGIQTQVEEWQKSGDDTALNSVVFVCA